MKFNHLTDDELVKYVIKLDDDPIRLRLATYMERIKGAIIDDLHDAGMDETYCVFRGEWGGDYLPGQYIKHLEEDLRIAYDELHQLREELKEQKARTVAELIAELRQEITTQGYMRREAELAKGRAEDEAKEVKEKLKMWNHLRTA